MEAINTLFNHVAARRTLLALRYPLFIGLVAVLLLHGQADRFWAAFAVAAVGEAIQLWAFASLVKNEELTARGPYVLVRNPMYLGRYVLILGVLMLFDSAWLLLGYTLVYWFYMDNRVRREERRLVKLLGEPYRRYCARVNRFLPTIAGVTDPMARYFSWEHMRRNHGLWNLAAVLAVFALIYFFVNRLFWLPG